MRLKKFINILISETVFRSQVFTKKALRDHSPINSIIEMTTIIPFVVEWFSNNIVKYNTKFSKTVVK